MDAYSTLFRLRLKNSVCPHAEERPFHATANILRQTRDVKELRSLILPCDSEGITPFFVSPSDLQNLSVPRRTRQTAGGFCTTC